MLAVLGYGTKVGLFPVHTWLPDAHSEAPTPVSALLSGSLLATSFYAILRFYQVASAALGTGFPRDMLLAFGIATLLLAALYVFGQRDIKRLLAYSSVEHMGILAIGVSFGAPIALAGVLLHVIAHAAAKGNAFMGAGVFRSSTGPKRSPRSRAGWRAAVERTAVPARDPRAVGAAAVRHLPQRVRDRVRRPGCGNYAAAAVLVVLVTVAFFGLAASATRMLAQPGEPAPRAPRRWSGGPVARPGGRPHPRRAERLDGRPGAGRAGGPGCSLGVHPPAELTELHHPRSGALGGAP